MNPADVDYIRSLVQQMEHFEFTYSFHSYFMCLFNSLLAITSLYYVYVIRINSNFELKPLAIYNTMCCWIAVIYSNLNQPIGLPKLGGGYSIGVVQKILVSFVGVKRIEICSYRKIPNFLYMGYNFSSDF
jgi:hypothetical protein